MIPPVVFITPVLQASKNVAQEEWEVLKNDKARKINYIPVILLLPLLTFATLPTVNSAKCFSSHSHSHKCESPCCKEKVITPIHSWANCSNSAVNQQSTQASKQICIYHRCLPDRFSQASWSRENMLNGSIMLTTHFLQITFALCVYCLQSIWQTSNGKDSISSFMHIFHLKGKCWSVGKYFRWESLYTVFPFLSGPFLYFFPSYSISLSSRGFSFSLFSYFGKDICKERKTDALISYSHSSSDL